MEVGPELPGDVGESEGRRWRHHGVRYGSWSLVDVGLSLLLTFDTCRYTFRLEAGFQRAGIFVVISESGLRY